jgi:hypothetical protein
MNIFRNKSKYELGLTKEPYEPIDLKAIYDKVRKKKEKEKIES